MPFVKMNKRVRGRVRARVRPNASGAYITEVKDGTVYFIQYPETPLHYIKWKPADPTYTKAIGYYDEPIPPYLLKPLTAISTIEVIPTGKIPVSKKIPPIDGVLYDTPITQIAPLPSVKTISGAFTPSTSARPIFNNSMVAKRLTILAAITNTGTVWIGGGTGLVSGFGFPLVAGAAKDFDGKDLNCVYLVAENVTDKVYYIADL